MSYDHLRVSVTIIYEYQLLLFTSSGRVTNLAPELSDLVTAKMLVLFATLVVNLAVYTAGHKCAHASDEHSFSANAISAQVFGNMTLYHIAMICSLFPM